MHLFLLRHGIAEDRRPGLPDAERHLTPEGIAEMHQVAAGMAALDLRIETIFSSPLPRALETARIAAEGLGLEPDAVIVDVRLAAGGFRLGDLQTLLSEQPHSARVLLVGHEPDFSTVIGHLIGGAILDMKKAGLARIEANRLEPGCGILRWLLTPQILKGVGSRQ